MAIVIVTKKCPHCRKTYSWDRAAPHIASPEVYPCPLCGGRILDTERNEWDLLPFQERLLTYVGIPWLSLLLSFGITVVIVVAFFGEDNERVFSVGPVVFPVAFLSLAILFSCKLRNRIRESRERLANPAYRKQLAALGLISSDEEVA